MLADSDPVALLLRVGRHFLHVDAPIGLASYLLVPLGAWLAYRQHAARNGEPLSAGSFVRYCLPRQVLTSRSCRIDLVYVSLKHFLNAWLLVPVLVSSVGVTDLARGFWDGTLGSRPEAVGGPWLLVPAIALCVLVQDLAQFLVHYAHHKLKILWHVHQVHHSAETLTFALSVKRTHMIEEAINLTLTSVVLGLTIGSLSYALGIAVWRSEMWGMDSWFLLSLFSFWHLRHSHISLSYGWFEHVLQSPAQHQLHHSMEREHWDKNFGLLFSFWDKLFGCFMRSVDPGSYRLGLPPVSRASYDSVLKLYVTPFLKIGETVIRAADRGRGDRPSLQHPAQIVARLAQRIAHREDKPPVGELAVER